MLKKLGVVLLVAIGMVTMAINPAQASLKVKNTSGYFIEIGTTKTRRGGKETYYRYYCCKCKKYGKKYLFSWEANAAYKLHKLWH